MKIGFCGLGKLGLPVALAIEAKGHQVRGFDIDLKIADYLQARKIPYQEADLQPLLDKTRLKLVDDYRDLVEWADLIFVAIQTPHHPIYEGVTKLPKKREDFNYNYLCDGIAELAKWALYLEKPTTIVTISTCLPDTYHQRIANLLNDYTHYIYNPFFIAMGTVIRDFYNPEFTLIGHENAGEQVRELAEFYQSIHHQPHLVTDITTAEAIKISYNTFITNKTVLANWWGELASRMGFKFDDIKRAWGLSSRRLLSDAYLDAGMGDGGGCHPRDNIALSWLADRLGMSYNLPEALMEAREKHAEFYADLICDQSDLNRRLPIIILGRSFKPETNIETGSAAILLSNILSERSYKHSHIENIAGRVLPPAIYFIGTKHARYAQIEFPEGSVVIDPFRYIPSQEGIELIAIGA